ncbi:MAG TPA: NrfD/PsrC family molybdoenzyme membrane anchor subunit [Intrasporangium sp.]|uniref:NrfD/PsrC family molybdoenzyme membrane anchor subunit n=1 Tax=Intrasporangium sp. TaxID=1925024 RepID=UPI002D78E299|nr:NrfD/PsrC family molybdoenzyme membrane anchor subunit [Intrasporangium sp.]HET7398108.1 NrfD/PsrC family molybdoenzyme membrane anchor subunit [Intrasporangium sp.]
MTTNPFDADRPPEQPRNGRRRRGGRRRRDESLMVPEAEFQSYYGHRVVKPAPWEADIAAYLFLGGLAAGSGLIAAGGAAAGYPALRRLGRFASVGAAALGGAALARDLGRPSRALNMMRTVKLTSPMSVGSWILTAFGGFSGLALATELGKSLPRQDSIVAKALRVADPPATIGSALFSAPLAAYTAVLLADTATPTWHESYRELPFVFVSSANAAASGLALLAAPSAQNGPARKLAAVSAAVEVLAFEKMQHTMGETLTEPLHEGRAGALIKASKILTIGGAVGAALFGRNRAAAAASGLALMAGSVCTRFGVFEAGIESAKDPRYTVEPQKERLERRRAAGITDDSITTSR